MEHLVVDCATGESSRETVSSELAAQIEADRQAAAAARIVYNGEQTLTERVTTTGTTPAELFRRTLAPLTAYSAVVELVGVDNGNGAMRALRATVAAKRLNSGAIMVGNPDVLSDHADTGADAWGISATVDDDDFVITVAGAAGRSVDWFARLRVDAFTPGGREPTPEGTLTAGGGRTR